MERERERQSEAGGSLEVTTMYDGRLLRLNRSTQCPNIRCIHPSILYRMLRSNQDRVSLPTTALEMLSDAAAIARTPPLRVYHALLVSSH